MTDRTDWSFWIEEAEELIFKFNNAVKYNRRDDEYSYAVDMTNFLRDTILDLNGEQGD